MPFHFSLSTMQILSAPQIKKWDAYTIANEPILSVNLMERAAGKCFTWLMTNIKEAVPYYVFCGGGNNGGDGLAVARMLFGTKKQVAVYILQQQNTSTDFAENLKRIQALPLPITYIVNGEDFPVIPDEAIVIDALFGSGLNRPLENTAAALVQHINRHEGIVVAIDIPSGLYPDQPSAGNTIIEATYTLTFQTPKLAFFMAENELFTGVWEVLNIGLHPDFIKGQPSSYQWIEKKGVLPLIHPLKKHTYKNKLGHALLYAGSNGMMGAAVMSAAACLRSGAGLLTVATTSAGLPIMQTANPQAMCLTEESWVDILNWKKFSAIGIGPGWGHTPDHKKVSTAIAEEWKGLLVVDASGLEQFSFEKEAENTIPANAVITPHPGEFDRLFGKQADSFARLHTALDKAAALNIYIVLKGAYTFIASPQGTGYFNSTGNPGMAKGGSGDVLTGLLTGLLAQGYSPLHACLLGVYLHGLAGDGAAAAMSAYSMNAMDIVAYLPEAWKKLTLDASFTINS